MYHYNLRPHHGLCLHFFRGAGYSDAFVQNMAAIQHALAQNPAIQLVAGADQVCAACHHRVGQTGCDAQQKVARYDAAVLALCQCQVGDVLAWDDFFAKVQGRILRENRLGEICSDCEWYAICSSLAAQDASSKSKGI